MIVLCIPAWIAHFEKFKCNHIFNYQIHCITMTCFSFFFCCKQLFPHIIFFFKNSSIWFYPRTLGYLVSVFVVIQEYGVWVPSPEVDLTSSQILAGESHRLCATSALADLAVRIPL